LGGGWLKITLQRPRRARTEALHDGQAQGERASVFGVRWPSAALEHVLGGQPKPPWFVRSCRVLAQAVRRSPIATAGENPIARWLARFALGQSSRGLEHSMTLRDERCLRVARQRRRSAVALHRFGTRPRWPTKATMACSLVPCSCASRETFTHSHGREKSIHPLAGEIGAGHSGGGPPHSQDAGAITGRPPRSRRGAA